MINEIKKKHELEKELKEDLNKHVTNIKESSNEQMDEIKRQ
jgi:hypothetical protein